MKLYLRSSDPNLGILIGEAKMAFENATNEKLGSKSQSDYFKHYNNLCMDIGRNIIWLAIVDGYESDQSGIFGGGYEKTATVSRKS
jgi:hypothetical protein